jgi:hypothetical protein
VAVKFIDVKEFRELGYLQELNRKFLHPHGLALCIQVESDGAERLLGVVDYREDLEGMYFEENTLEASKTLRVKELEDARRGPREAALGYWVQPESPK